MKDENLSVILTKIQKKERNLMSSFNSQALYCKNESLIQSLNDVKPIMPSPIVSSNTLYQSNSSQYSLRNSLSFPNTFSPMSSFAILSSRSSIPSTDSLNLSKEYSNGAQAIEYNPRILFNGTKKE